MLRRLSDGAQEATAWAKEKGSFNGDGNGEYDWKEPIAREQVAVIMYNLCAASCDGN